MAFKNENKNHYLIDLKEALKNNKSIQRFQILAYPMPIDNNFGFVIYNEKKEAIIIDPGHFESSQKVLADLNLNLKFIFNTHHHADHIAGNEKLIENFNTAKIIGFNNFKTKLPSLKSNNKYEFHALDLDWEILEVPGHTKDHIAFVCKELNAIFTGDCVFALSVGKVFCGSIEDLYSSIEKIKTLNEDLDLFSAHNYAKNNFDFYKSLHLAEDNSKELETDLKLSLEEAYYFRCFKLSWLKRYNPFFRCSDFNSFRELRFRKDLF